MITEKDISEILEKYFADKNINKEDFNKTIKEILEATKEILDKIKDQEEEYYQSGYVDGFDNGYYNRGEDPRS